MKKITCLFVAFGIAASFAAAGDGEGCPSCKGTAKEPTALALARKAIADVPKADEKLAPDQLAKVKESREFLMTFSFGKAMGQTYETCGLLSLAAAVQPGTSPEAAKLLKEMGATYCMVAKMFGGCADCACCEDSEECCAACSKDMTPEAMAKKANEALEASKKSFAAAVAECEKMTPEQHQKVQASVETLREISPCMPAMEKATTALGEAFATLAKLGVPSTDPKNATRDGLVKAVQELHNKLCCSECEEGEECAEGAEPTEKVAEAAKSS